MLTEMPSRLLSEWIAYHSLEPFGDELLDLHLATLAAITANANRGKGQSAKQVKDFRLWKADVKTSAEGLWSRLKSWAILSQEPNE